jgi:putative DNA primase/helicase
MTRSLSVDQHQLLGTAALALCRRGWNLIPLAPSGKQPFIAWREFQERRATDTEARAWWARWPEANVGVVTGAISGLVVLDVDPRHGGDASLVQLEATYGALPRTIEARTGGGGRHLFFAHPGVPVRSRAGHLGPGLDVRGDGGYVVVPPSVHPSGVPYAWVNPPDAADLAPLPAWLRARVVEPAAVAPAAGSPNADSRHTPVREGQRNTHLTSLAGAMRRRGSHVTAISVALHAANAAGCDPSLPGSEVDAIVASVARYPSAEVDALEPHTDRGNARRLVAQHGEDLRYVPQWRAWLVWDGVCWRRDEAQRLMALAKATIRTLYIEASAAPDRVSQDLAKHGARSESAARLGAMVSLAQSEPGIPVTPDQLDRDPWKLTVPNGTLDLRTGALGPHGRADLITKLAPVPYEPDARCPTWLAFLDQITQGQRDLIAFLQRAAGYALTGDTREQCLFILYGTGANGKSTFLNTLRAVLGDYAKQTPTETLLVKRDGGIPNDLARLHGARFVAAVEAEAGRRLAESLVKQLTGGDRIAARFLYGELFEFTPEFKVFVATNHKPTIRGSDHAIWRRIRLIPFTVTIPPSAQDRALPEKLRAELPGILRWMVEGCLAWQREGLGIPDAVHTATEGYRAEMDVLATFLAECCAVGKGLRVPASELYAAYVGWCGDAGERAMSQRALGAALTERGFTPGRTEAARLWRGLALRPRDEDDA